MRPGPTALRLLAWWTAAALAAAFSTAFLAVWAVLGVALLALASAAYARLSRVPPPRVERTADRTLALGVFREVRLTITNGSARALSLEVHDLHPPACETDGLPRAVSVPANGVVEVPYRLRPTRRGDLEFGRTEVLLAGKGGLWKRRVLCGAGQPVRVVPNFRAVARFALLAVDDRLGRMGIRVARRRGEGNDFEELREYRDGDSLRRVDWKATSRRRQLISRQYRDERDQQVVCLVDCGRRMRAQDGDLTHFDHVLNTVLLLTYVALKAGDAVGLMTFSGESRFLPPVRGAGGLETMVRSVYDLETTTSPSDYLEAATRLMSRQSRRALVILVTNVRDEDSAELVPALRLLRTRHLVLLASLRESVLAGALAKEPRDLAGALVTASVHQYLLDRERVFDELKGHGLLALDVEPESLPLKLVNRYLDIKRGGML